MHPTPSRLWILSAALLLQLGMTAGLSAQQPGTSPVKIYLMIGQSNMEGHGEINPVETQGTLEYIVANDPGSAYQFLKSGADWVVRDDVWMHYARLGGTPRTGNLEPGYGAAGANNTIGPELGFGHKMGNTHGNQVLLVKAAWGGRSLGNDFLPPSSGSNPEEARGYGDPGYYYKETLRLLDDATSKLAAYFPNYDGQGYEIAGICWHQGFNDRVTPAYSAVYQVNMANFIRDIRSDLGVPGLPFVIATTGMGGGTTYTQVELAQMAMTNATTYPDFVGNVAVVDTRANYTPLGLDFWQPVANSPQNQDYHWNRNAKTYLHIGLAMGHEMPLLTSPRCPSRLLATGGPAGVTLTWQNGTEMPTSVQVLRDGVSIAAAAPVSPTSFIDTTALPGVHNYQLVFTMPGDPCDPLTVTHDSGIRGLTAYRSQNGVMLEWTNNLGYAGIRIQRNGSTIAAAHVGSATSYEDTTAPVTGLLTYTVVPTTGTSTQAQVVINLGPHDSGGALIHEPFDFAAGSSLNGQTPSGTGLSGTWARHSGSVSNEFVAGASGLAYETFPVAGNRLKNSATGGGRAVNVSIGTTLSNAGLLTDGATLWFSILVQPVTGANSVSGFGLADGNATSYNSVVNAVGINVQNGSDLEYWSNVGGTFSRSAAKNDLTVNIPHLVVGKLVWGTGGANDTFELFLPDTALNQGSRFGSLQSINVNQSTFDRIIVYNSGGGIEYDEIRFGASYDDVIGAAVDTSGDNTPPAPAQMSWATPPYPISDNAISMTAVTASDENGVQYRFHNTTLDTYSGWQASPSHTATGLQTGTTYGFSVQARDMSVNNNTNLASAPVAEATTHPADATPPPVPTLVTPLGPVTATEISMTANAVTDPEGGAVEYRFHNVTLGTVSDWQADRTFTATGLMPDTSYEFTVQARDSASPPNESTTSSPAVSASTLPPVGGGSALFYEPFTYGEGALQSGSGWSKISGTDTVNFAVQATGLSYGTLPTSGKHIKSTGGNMGYTLNSVATAINEAGLLAHGQTLWMSAVIQAQSTANSSLVVRLGTDSVNGFYTIASGGSSVGFNLQNGDDLQYRYHLNGTGSGNLNITQTLSQITPTLIVIEMIWNANSASADTINYYRPNAALDLGSVQGTLNTIAFDQTAFDTFSIGASGTSGLLDEIRFGASYNDVIGVGSSGTLFANWIGEFGLAPSAQGFNFDADGDGIPNGVEAWFGTDPSVGGPGLKQVARSGSTVSFTHPEADPALSDVTGSYEWSLDLSTWNASTATQGSTTVTLLPTQNVPTPGTTTVTASITGTEPAKVFIRAVATQP